MAFLVNSRSTNNVFGEDLWGKMIKNEANYGQLFSIDWLYTKILMIILNFTQHMLTMELLLRYTILLNIPTMMLVKHKQNLIGTVIIQIIHILMIISIMLLMIMQQQKVLMPELGQYIEKILV